MKFKLSKYTYVYAGLLAIGVVGGFVYWNYWGCTDSCPIDSSWKWSVARGGTIGLCVAAIFHPRKKESKTPLNTENDA